ncbi:aldo/keto reductase [[Clostridium] polysaccharolyticum]|uniref:Aldo/keto reductase n=1 Tax=[Clostridium] polysaccharolyticum TaxID=29364 RepID=A0A1H9Y483_9FIRM|nr:aldo/keto reductase [[Clostridium] polysaccharolyticum]SES63632.1 Aldo/keto reductase [[Clostridium] polysaccharolyticum]
MEQLKEYFTMYHGVKIPNIGYGTWEVHEGQLCQEAVKKAIELGYRHIDTAAGYGNENSVGTGIANSGVPREELFITSKLNNPDHGYEKTMAAFEDTMNKLKCDYLDLYLIHWPNPLAFRDCWEESNAGSWRAMEELYEAGRIKAIGVSNFWVHHLEALMKTAKIKPMVNQIRLCPGDVHKETVEYCQKHNILLEAYSPFGRGEVFKVKEIHDLVDKYHRSIAQICIRWCIQQGFVPLPKSVTETRMIENLKVYDFELEEPDIQMMTELTGRCGISKDPDAVEF